MLADDALTSLHLALRSLDALARRLGAGGDAVSVGALLRELQAPGGRANERLSDVRRLRGEVKDDLDDALRCAHDVSEREDDLAAVGVPPAIRAAVAAAVAGIDAGRVAVDAALGDAGDVSARLRVAAPRERTTDVDALLAQVEGVLADLHRHATAALAVLEPLADWAEAHEEPGSPEGLAALGGVLADIRLRLGS